MLRRSITNHMLQCNSCWRLWPVCILRCADRRPFTALSATFRRAWRDALRVAGSAGPVEVVSAGGLASLVCLSLGLVMILFPVNHFAVASATSMLHRSIGCLKHRISAGICQWVRGRKAADGIGGEAVTGGVREEQKPGRVVDMPGEVSRPCCRFSAAGRP